MSLRLLHVERQRAVVERVTSLKPTLKRTLEETLKRTRKETRKVGVVPTNRSVSRRHIVSDTHALSVISLPLPRLC